MKRYNLTVKWLNNGYIGKDINLSNAEVFEVIKNIQDNNNTFDKRRHREI